GRSGRPLSGPRARRAEAGGGEDGVGGGGRAPPGPWAYTSDARIATPSLIRSGVSKLNARRALDDPSPLGKKSAPLTNVTPAAVARRSRSAASVRCGRSTQRK